MCSQTPMLEIMFYFMAINYCQVILMPKIFLKMFLISLLQMLIISQANSAPAPLPGLLTWLKGKTLIDIAAEGEFDPLAIESMLQSVESEKAKKLVLQQDSKLNTPLFIHSKSAKPINYRSIQLLLEHGKAEQLNRMMNADGLGALQLVIKQKDQRLLQYLLEQGANPEGPRNVRWPFPLVTPLQLAFGYKSLQDLQSVKILLAYGANPKSVNRTRDIQSLI